MRALVTALLCVAVAAGSSNCPIPKSYSIVPENAATLSGWISMSKGMAKGIYKPLDDKTMKALSDVVFSNVDVSGDTINHLVNDALQQEGGVIAWQSFGVFIVLCSFAAGISILCVRCCCNACGADSHTMSGRSSVCAVLATLMAALALALMVTGAVEYASSVNRAADAIKYLDENVDGISRDMMAATSYATCDILDAAKTNVDATFSQASESIKALPSNLFSAIKNRTAVDDLINFDSPKIKTNVQSAESLIGTIVAMLQQMTNQGQAAKDESDAIITALNGLDLDTIAKMIATWDGIHDKLAENLHDIDQQITTQTQASVDAVVTSISSEQNKITNSINSITDINEKIAQKINDTETVIVKHSGKGDESDIRTISLAVVLVPVCIGIAFTALTILAGVVLVFNRHTGGAGGRCTSMIVLIGSYYHWFFILWPMTCAVLLYTAGFVALAACEPLFNDPSFSVYQYMPNQDFKITSPNGKEMVVSAEGFLRSCAGGATVFAAMDGKKLIQPDDIVASLGLQQRSSDMIALIKSMDLNLVSTDMNTFQAALHNQSTLFGNQLRAFVSLKTQSGYLPINIQEGVPNAKAAEQNLESLEQNLITISLGLKSLSDSIHILEANGADGNIKQYITSQTVRDAFSEIELLAGSGLTDMVEELSTVRASCAPFYKVYTNIGEMTCGRVGDSLQGAWAGAGLAAIAFPLAAAAAVCIASAWKKRKEVMESTDSVFYRPPISDSRQLGQSRGLRRYE